MNLRRLRHISAVAALVLTVTALGCNPFADADTAAKAVDGFHAAFNAERYQEIYAAAAPEFRDATKESDWIELLAAVRRKIGPFESARQTTVNVNSGTQGTAVNQTFAATFREGSATERFSWAMRNGKALLVGYRIESQLLITR